MNVFLRYFLSLPLLIACGAQISPQIMLGPVTTDSAIVWLNGGGKQLQLRFMDASQPRTTQWQTARQVFVEGTTRHLLLSPLQAGHVYRYQLVNPDNGKVLAEHQVQIAAAPASGNLDVFLGSCAYLTGWPFERKPIFESLAQHAQQDQTEHLMLWLGDNLYYQPHDLANASDMLARYHKQRAFPGIAALLLSMPNYAIWDDWDFGGNDSDRKFAGQKDSRIVFRAMWPMPLSSMGDAGGQGMYYRFARGDVEFFMLDDRTFRDADVSADRPDKSMFGAQQIQWLQQSLLHSKAHYKVIASGSSLLNGVAGNEGWHNFPRERLAFFSWLVQQEITGIVLLSGDAHHTRLTLNHSVAGQPIYELTCSPLSSQVESYRKQTLMPGQNNLLVVNQNNYCQLAFRQQKNILSLTVSIWGESGQKLIEYPLDMYSSAGKH